MEYLNLFGRKDRSGMSRLLKDDWSKDRRGPEAEATIHRSAAVTKGLTQKVDRAGLYPPYGLDFTYDTESFIASAELHMLAIFTSPRLHPHSKPEPIRHYVLSSKWDWRPKAMPTKHEGSRFMRFWREMLVVGTSESALEPDERPYVEAFTFSGHASFCLEAGAFLGLP